MQGQSLEEGRFVGISKNWCHCPVFKKGDKQDPANYRPVGLTCIASKILEKIASSTLIDHFRINKLLSNKQFGFLKGRSTNIQMIRVMDD